MVEMVFTISYTPVASRGGIIRQPQSREDSGRVVNYGVTAYELLKEHD